MGNLVFQKGPKLDFLIKEAQKKILHEIYLKAFLTCIYIKKQLKVLLDFKNGSDPNDGIITITPLGNPF